MMTAEEAVAAAKGLSFEKVWAMFQETDKQIKETDKQIKELTQKTDRQIAEVSKNIGGLSNSFGKWAEEMISTKLWEKFKVLGYTFTHGGPHKYWEGDQTVVEVDVLLEDGDYVMAVEIKSVLMEKDVDGHLERLEKLREQLDKKGKDPRKLLGAVAGMVVSNEVKKYAQKKGLYVLVQSGDLIEVAEAPQ
ncbi:MAG: hypothetical protein LBU00_04245, partial [Treponema sp.]|nr:hypothetical protein [Treponema sp.]